MTLLTRMIVVEWFKSLIGALTALLLLVSVADIINGFLQGKDAARVLLEWSLKMPDLSGKILPVTCLLATLFALNRLKTHNELIATLAAGYSTFRANIMIGICASTMVFLQFANLGFLEPYANKVKRQEITKSQRSEGKYLTRSAVDGGQFWFKSKDYFATFLSFDKQAKSLMKIRFYHFSAEGFATKIVTAEKAVFKDGHTWTLQRGNEISDLQGSRFPRSENFVEKDVQLQETPRDFSEFEADLTTLPWFSLKDFITKIAPTGINTAEYQVLLHQKLALSFVCLVFALIPMGGLYRPNRRNDSFGKNVAFALILTVVFWLLFSWSLTFGVNGKMPAWLAAYAVPGLFFLQSIWAFWRNRKLAF